MLSISGSDKTSQSQHKDYANGLLKISFMNALLITLIKVCGDGTSSSFKRTKGHGIAMQFSASHHALDGRYISSLCRCGE